MTPRRELKDRPREVDPVAALNLKKQTSAERRNDAPAVVKPFNLITARLKTLVLS